VKFGLKSEPRQTLLTLFHMKTGRSLVLKVPGIIVPEELNYLINPKHPDFTHLDLAGAGRDQNQCYG
jgi:hypothetical protein